MRSFLSRAILANRLVRGAVSFTITLPLDDNYIEPSQIIKLFLGVSLLKAVVSVHSVSSAFFITLD